MSPASASKGRRATAIKVGPGSGHGTGYYDTPHATWAGRHHEVLIIKDGRGHVHTTYVTQVSRAEAFALKSISFYQFRELERPAARAFGPGRIFDLPATQPAFGGRLSVARAVWKPQHAPNGRRFRVLLGTRSG